MEPDTQT